MLADFIDVKGIKANGNRLSQHEVKSISLSNNEEIEPVIEQKAIVSSTSDDESSATDSEVEQPIEPANQASSDAEPESEDESSVQEEQSDDEPATVKEAVEKALPIVKEPAEKELPVVKKPVEAVLPAPEKHLNTPVKPSNTTVETSNPDHIPAKPEPKEQPVVKEKKAWGSKDASKPKAPAVKDVKLEITNPDDIDIDEKGQTKLF